MTTKTHSDQDQKLGIMVEFGTPPIWSLFFTAVNGKNKEVQFHARSQAESFAKRHNLRIIFIENATVSEE